MSVPRRAHGRIVTVFAAKGGYGKTTLSTNLAVTLNASGARVCLVDLDFEFGDIARWLRLEPTRTLLDAIPLQGKLNAAGGASLITPYRPALDCILAPVDPGQAAKLPSNVTAELLAVLPSLYDYVVVDAPAKLSLHTLSALDSSHHHVLLSTPERPALKNLRRTLDTLELLSYGRQLRSVVINQAGSRLGLTAEEINRLVRSPIAARVPYIWDVPAAINRGVPLAISRPDHPVVRAIGEFARAHLTAERAAQPGFVAADGAGRRPA
ncbi:MAG: AAA family ATPase [Actinophytocola sp.]|nr:AAA family ATPase [Actinophytocola sp.]